MMNGIIAPIAGLTIRGVLFYQGENNCFGDWEPFPKTFPAVISDWRKTFHNADLPFGIIQISGWSTRRSMTYDMNHPTNIIREIQFNTWRNTPHTGLMVTFDTNASRGFHPSCKQPVGQRSARWALAEVYKVTDARRRQPLAWRGPMYDSLEIVDGKCVVHFDKTTTSGLVLDQDVDVGFYIAGADKEFHHARARVDEKNGTVIVWSDDVKTPVAVRYGWSNLPAGGLMNRKELPAYPFRSDTWPLKSHADTTPYLR
jgi:sialate O-acetylesterase